MFNFDENEKFTRILEVVKCFLETNGSMEEISDITGVPKSSVQRYLHDPYIIDELGQEVYDHIQEQIKNNKLAGLVKGGTNYAANNNPTKDEVGKFTGSRKK